MVPKTKFSLNKNANNSSSKLLRSTKQTRNSSVTISLDDLDELWLEVSNNYIKKPLGWKSRYSQAEASRAITKNNH